VRAQEFCAFLLTWTYIDVAETLIGLLWSDGSSYLRQAPNWKPPDHNIRSMGDLISFALK
jgi:hypothetical protein